MELPELINKAYDAREEYRKLYAATQEKKTELDLLQQAIIDLLRLEQEHNGLESIRTNKASATLMTTTVPAVDDWDTFLNWVRDNDMMYMLYRQVKLTAFNEYVDMYGEAPPGTHSLELYKLSLQTNR